MNKGAFESWLVEALPIDSSWADDQSLMQVLVELSAESIKHGGGPFAAAIVSGSMSAGRLNAPYRVLGVARNEVELLHDHTAHAEMQVMRRLEQAQASWDLAQGEQDQARWNGVLFTTGFPCVGCMGWILQARFIRKIVWAASAEDIEKNAGFSEGHDSLSAATELFEKKGFEVVGPVCSAEACVVLRSYAEQGGLVYTGLNQTS